MLNINKEKFIESGLIQTILEEEVIKVRRNEFRILNGEKETNYPVGQNGLKLLRNILNVVIATGKNELCVPKSNLTELFACDPSNTNKFIKKYFKGYGLGEYSYSNKYKITVIDKDKKIKRGTHYYLYINKETLELMKSSMNIEGIDFDDLIDQIPDCENKRQIIENKTQTEINVINYIDEEFLIQYKINIEKNLFSKEGHYSKETTVKDREEGIVVSSKKKENDFIPKQCNESSMNGINILLPDSQICDEIQQEEVQPLEEVSIEEETTESVPCVEEVKEPEITYIKYKGKSFNRGSFNSNIVEYIDNTVELEDRRNFVTREINDFIRFKNNRVDISSKAIFSECNKQMKNDDEFKVTKDYIFEVIHNYKEVAMDKQHHSKDDIMSYDEVKTIKCKYNNIEMTIEELDNKLLNNEIKVNVYKSVINDNKIYGRFIDIEIDGVTIERAMLDSNFGRKALLQGTSAIKYLVENLPRKYNY